MHIIIKYNKRKRFPEWYRQNTWASKSRCWTRNASNKIPISMHMRVCCSTENGNLILTRSFWEVLPKTNPPKRQFHSKTISSTGNFHFIQPRYFLEYRTPVHNLTYSKKYPRLAYLLALRLYFRFKSLSNQEKLDVITIRDRDFIQKFLKFSA